MCIYIYMYIYVYVYIYMYIYVYIYTYIHLYYVYHIYILCIYTHEAVMCNSQAKETKPRPNSRGLAWISATHWLLRYSECCYRMEPQT